MKLIVPTRNFTICELVEAQKASQRRTEKLHTTHRGETAYKFTFAYIAKLNFRLIASHFAIALHSYVYVHVYAYATSTAGMIRSRAVAANDKSEVRPPLVFQFCRLRIRAVYRHGRAESEGSAIATGLNGTTGSFMSAPA